MSTADERGMEQTLRILILEDVPTDAELIERELRRAGIKFAAQRVDTREDFIRALEAPTPDLILADYKLPAFDGLQALAIARERVPHVPFIFVTGAMGEEFAIETMVQGATDYVLKDRLSKLVPAVERACKEARELVQRRHAEDALRQRLDEVERLNRLMVGRELKMAEMKTEIAELKKEIAALKESIEGLKEKVER